MVANPRCVECDAPVTEQSQLPCWRCIRAWQWLHEEFCRDEQGRRLYDGWLATAALLHEQDVWEWLTGSLTIVSWRNRVITLAGWERERRWFARRYRDLLMATVKTDKQPVFVTPRVGATMARQEQRERGIR